KRFYFPVPVASISLYSYIAGLLTPVPVQICRCLLEGTRNEVICLNDKIKKFVPIETLGYKQAVLRALSREEQDRVYTRWSDAYPPAHELAIKLHEIKGRSLYTSYYSLLTQKPAGALFQSICRIGGKGGWFHSNWMWRLRGIMDRVLMGVGTSRGRKSASTLGKNDVIDFWRVEEYKANERLLLRAEMKLPGRAWLEFRIEREGDKNRLIVQAHYQTRTLFGKLYWYAFLPFHVFIFQDLIRMIERKSIVNGKTQITMPQ
ncbi:MAG: SDR family oxidoreductase, partial [Acidobacteriota bacterium]